MSQNPSDRTIIAVASFGLVCTIVGGSFITHGFFQSGNYAGVVLSIVGLIGFISLITYSFRSVFKKA